MYPRNAASPERIAIGPVILISDGTPQSSGVTITVRGQGGAEGAGGGTIAYGATGVIVYYTPIQAETDFTSFTVIASKASCIPVSVTVITSASGTPGYAGVDWAKVTAPTTTLNLSGTTIKTATDIATAVDAVDNFVDTEIADIQARLPAALTAGGLMKADALAINAVLTTAVTTVKAVQGLAVDGVITTLTNLPAITANWLTAAGTAADFGAELATAIWTDTVGTDFTTALSVGKSLMNGVTLGTGLTINAYTGNTVQTGDSFAIVNSGTFGNSALKTLIDAVDNFVDTEIADIQARLPAALTAGGSIKADALAWNGLPTVALPLVPTVAGRALDVSSGGEAGMDWANIGSPTTTVVLSGTTVGVTTTNTDMITAAQIRTAIGLASANLDTQLSTIDDFLDTEIAAILAAVDTEVAAIQTAVVTTIPATLAALLTTAMTESVRTDGATGSVAQLLYETIAHLGESSIVSTTKTTKRVNGSTTFGTYTLDSATAPTSITRAS